MSDILEAVEAKNVQKRHKDADAKKLEQKRAAALQASAKAQVKRKHRKVLGALLIRVTGSLAAVAGLWISMHFGLIKSAFATPVICAVLMWASAWVGAYVQHRIGKEGLFK